MENWNDQNKKLAFLKSILLFFGFRFSAYKGYMLYKVLNRNYVS